MEASGGGLSYQWFGPNGDSLTDSDGGVEGSATVTLQIVVVQSGDAGNYRVVVSSIGGSVGSEEATLTIGESN